MPAKRVRRKKKARVERCGSMVIERRRRKKSDSTPDLSGVKEKGGPSTIFLPDHLDLARRIALQGYTDEEVARMYGFSPDIMEAWRDLYPDFNKAIEEGRTHCDAEVVRALYQRATGYDYNDEVAVGGKNPQVLTLKRHAVPDVDAIKYWTKNRRKDQWKDKHDHQVKSENETKVGLEERTKSELIDSIVNLIHPKDDSKPPNPDKKASEKRNRQDERKRR